MGRREQRQRRAARQRRSDSSRERVRQRVRLEHRVLRRSRPEVVPWWGRVIAGVLLLPVLVLAVVPWTHAEADLVWWLENLTLVTLLLVLFGGACGVFLAPRVTKGVVVAIGWVFPVGAAWLAVLMWTDWREFYGGTRVKINSEGDARIVSFIVVAVAAYTAYLYLQLLTHKRRPRR